MDFGKKRILLVEDDFYIRDIYKKALDSAGFVTDIAIDGSEAIQKGRENEYDLILLDIMLPGINGLMVMRSFKAQDSLAKNTPVFLLTNLGQENIISEAFKIGADRFILKSQVNPEHIIAEINKFLEQPKPAALTNIPPAPTTDQPVQEQVAQVTENPQQASTPAEPTTDQNAG